MSSLRWGDNLLRVLEYDSTHRVYRVPRLNGFAHATGEGYWYFTDQATGRGLTEARIAVEGSKFHLDGFLDTILREPVPHTKLRRTPERPHPYRYDPWEMNIWVDEHNPSWGNTFKATFHGAYQLKLNRLKNFRAFLKLLQEAKHA